jgi:hypothetical protein
MKRTGLGGRRNSQDNPNELAGKDDQRIIVDPPQPSFTMLLTISVISLLGAGSIAFLVLNASSIDLICKPLGNCKRFREASDQAEKTIELAQNKLNAVKSLADLNAASQLVNDSKVRLSSIDESAKDLAFPLSTQKARADELDKKIAVLVALEQKADQSLKEAIAKTKQADALNRDPQGAKEDPNKARERLMQPKLIYIEAQSLLKSIPEKSLVAGDRQKNLALVSDKIKDLDNKLSAIKALDPCVVNPDACKPVDPCVANPDACKPPVTSEPEPIYEPAPPPPSRPNRPLFGPGSY